MSGKRRAGDYVMAAGALMLAAALALTGFNLWDGRRAGEAAETVLAEMPEHTPRPSPGPGDEAEIPDYVLNPGMDMPTVEIDGYEYIGTLSIPALGLELPVMDGWSYPALRVAPCRYLGSAYSGGFVIMAHNYARHFGAIGTLAPGEAVSFTDVDGNVFEYSVAETQILQPTAVDEMNSGGWDLTLFTCTPGGRTRVTVRCAAAEPEYTAYTKSAAS